MKMTLTFQLEHNNIDSLLFTDLSKWVIKEQFNYQCRRDAICCIKIFHLNSYI